MFQITKHIFWSTSYSSWEYVLQDLFHFFKENLDYYQSAFRVDGVNSLREYIYLYSMEHMRAGYYMLYHSKEIPLKDRIMIEHGIKGTLWVIEQWILSGATEPVNDLAKYTYENFSPEYRQFVDCVYKEQTSS